MPPGRRPTAARAARRGPGGVPLAGVERRRADVGLGLAEHARERIGRRDEGPRLPQRRHQRLDLRRLQRGEALLELLLRLLLEASQPLAVDCLPLGRRLPDQEVEEQRRLCLERARPAVHRRQDHVAEPRQRRHFHRGEEVRHRRAGDVVRHRLQPDGLRRGGRLLLEGRRRRRGRRSRRRRRRLLEPRLRQRRRGEHRRGRHGREELPSLHRLPLAWAAT